MPVKVREDRVRVDRNSGVLLEQRPTRRTPIPAQMYGGLNAIFFVWLIVVGLDVVVGSSPLVVKNVEHKIPFVFEIKGLVGLVQAVVHPFFNGLFDFAFDLPRKINV